MKHALAAFAPKVIALEPSPKAGQVPPLGEAPQHRSNAAPYYVTFVLIAFVRRFGTIELSLKQQCGKVTPSQLYLRTLFILFLVPPPLGGCGDGSGLSFPYVDR